MNFRNRLQFHLVKLLQCSNKQAIQYCSQGLVQVDGATMHNAQQIITPHQELVYNGQIIRKGHELVYLAMYKPVGYECTSNPAITDNIYTLLPEKYHECFTVGRLDKNSEGLLLLTNDGQSYRQLVGQHSHVEKVYTVETVLPITEPLLEAFRKPFRLGPRTTLPAKCIQLTEYSFEVVLTEGINRQIRRICAKSGNQVKRLIRTQVGTVKIDELTPGAFRRVSSITGVV